MEPQIANLLGTGYVQVERSKFLYAPKRPGPRLADLQSARSLGRAVRPGAAPIEVVRSALKSLQEQAPCRLSEKRRLRGN